MRINTDLEEYIAQHTTPEDQVLQELTRQTYLSTYNPRMISGLAQGKFLEFVCDMLKPKNILEIGTFTGYSTIRMTRGALPNVHVDTIEINDELAENIQKTFNKANLSEHITLHIGNALEIIKKLNQMYDLVYIDGDKCEYPEYYASVIDKVNVGGYIIADNVLWNEKVIDAQQTDKHTNAVRMFNKIVQDDNRVENTFLAVRDGLMFIKKLH